MARARGSACRPRGWPGAAYARRLRLSPAGTHAAAGAVQDSVRGRATTGRATFVQGLRNALLVHGAQLLHRGCDKAATATVHVLDDKHDAARRCRCRRTTCRREYELTYTVRFSVTAGDKELLAAQEVSTTREYSFAVSELLAKGTRKPSCRRRWRTIWPTSSCGGCRGSSGGSESRGRAARDAAAAGRPWIVSRWQLPCCIITV